MSLKRIVCRSRASCLIHCWIIHFSHIHNTTPLYFHHLIVTAEHPTHGQQDGFVVCPCTVRSQVVSPTPPWRSAVQRWLQFTDHQGGHSVDNSGEDVTSAPVFSEVEGRQSIGRLASPLPMQKRVERSKCNPREKIITLNSHSSPSQGDSFAHNTQTTRLFRLWATHSPLTGCDPDVIVEISSTEVAPSHR